MQPYYPPQQPGTTPSGPITPSGPSQPPRWFEPGGTAGGTSGEGGNIKCEGPCGADAPCPKECTCYTTYEVEELTFADGKKGRITKKVKSECVTPRTAAELDFRGERKRITGTEIDVELSAEDLNCLSPCGSKPKWPTCPEGCDCWAAPPDTRGGPPFCLSIKTSFEWSGGKNCYEFTCNPSKPCPLACTKCDYVNGTFTDGLCR